VLWSFIAGLVVGYVDSRRKGVDVNFRAFGLEDYLPDLFDGDRKHPRPFSFRMLS
jgi:hypothetical protein